MFDTTPGTAQKQKITLCSDVSEASGEDPAGTAWAARRFLMMELGLPWEYFVLKSKRAPAGLHDLVMELYSTLGEDWGMIGMAPDPHYSVEGRTRIIDLRQDDAVASAFHRDTYLVPADNMVEYVRLLCYEPEHPDLLPTKQPDDQVTRDFFICTHAAIDACCATIGYPMYRLLRAMADQSTTPTRVWRCTHFGGHRFAATAFEAPQGRYWAHLKADMLSSLMHRSVPVRKIRQHYRGWAALPEPLWQVAEAEVFARAGWAWNDVTITALEGKGDADNGGRFTMRFEHPATGAGSVTLDITPTGSVRTLEQSNSDDYVDVMQYDVALRDQQPAGILDRMAGENA